MGRETWFYREVLPSISIAPACLLVAEAEDVVVLEYVDAVPLHQIALTEPESTLALMPELATALARLHLRSGHDAAATPRAILPLPPLDPVDLDVLMVVSAATLDIIERVQSRNTLTAAVESALAGPGPQGLVHADLKLDNILRPRPDGGIVVVDWELGGMGPTGWDIGCVVGAMLALWCSHLALDSATDPADWIDSGAVPFESVQLAACSFMEAYLKEMRGAAVADFGQVTTFIAANLVARTFSESTHVRRLSAHHLVRLLVAEGILLSPDELFGDLRW
ncbi:hypothetical protein Aple_036150 [Acrocarpospora pleiomorpha]|uniref:Aminoglycoside phosphotransferase domain-containing protein n=1 Tax=Acrocarpospora pleiomorpha TaxID=90975 RepID=A0A5M3XKP2_9ACTN|nr:aminoglycoside phosphotransferase family protein [Acrocarpospora pleiomorpha]GES20719.1 hypothetical protein Aple_036150 [Acrocarpospora pleiomorpha]